MPPRWEKAGTAIAGAWLPTCHQHRKTIGPMIGLHLNPKRSAKNLARNMRICVPSWGASSWIIHTFSDCRDVWGSNGITRCWINPQIVLYLYGYRIYNIYNIIYIYVCVCGSYSILYILIVTCSDTTLEVTSPHLALVFAELPSSQLQLWRQHKDLLDPRAMSLPPGPRRCRFQLNEQIFHDEHKTHIDTMDTQMVFARSVRDICLQCTLAFMSFSSL